MIINQQDLDDLTQFYECHCIDFKHLDDERWMPMAADSTEYFANHPHLLFPLGYDDYRSILYETDPIAESRVMQLGFGDSLARGDFAMPYEPFFRNAKSGEWLWFEGITHFKGQDAIKFDRGRPYYLHFVSTNNRAQFLTVNHLFRKLERIKGNPDSLAHSILLPGIWTPHVQIHQKLLLESTAKALIREVYDGQKELRAYHWRELEEIVAELLSAKGLEIVVTPRSRDGGRDVVARGELIPGELSVIAVEVKQKNTVGLHDVQRALKANEDFPSLLLATSGVFSAGVIHERQRQRHQLRLILKDGIALRQWIAVYAAQKRWSFNYGK